MGVAVIQAILSVIITAIVFLLVPAILCFRGKLYSNKTILIITIVNAVVATVLYLLITYLLGFTVGGVNLLAVILWSTVSNRLMKKFCGLGM